MDDQNRYPHDSGDSSEEQAGAQSGAQSGTPSGTPAAPDAADTSQTWFGDYTEQTRPIPSYQQPPPPWSPGYTPSATPSRTSRGRGLTAAVLAGALVLGGAAGVGGAALYGAVTDNGSTGTTSTETSGPFQSTKNAVVQDGTVEKVARAVLPSVVKVNVTTSSSAGSGSGIVLSKDGKILTNNHVVAGAGNNGSITVNFNDGTTRRAKVIGT